VTGALQCTLAELCVNQDVPWRSCGTSRHRPQGPFQIGACGFGLDGTFFKGSDYSAMSDDAARYFRQAKVCLDEAEKATSPVDKEAWLKLREEWLAMAEKAQRSQSQSPK